MDEVVEAEPVEVPADAVVEVEPVEDPEPEPVPDDPAARIDAARERLRAKIAPPEPDD